MVFPGGTQGKKRSHDRAKEPTDTDRKAAGASNLLISNCFSDTKQVVNEIIR